MQPMAVTAPPAPAPAAGRLQPIANVYRGAEAWRVHLMGETTKVGRNIRKTVAEQHHIRAASHRKIKCTGCNQDKFQLDLVTFHCTNSGDRNRTDVRTGHQYCTECVSRYLRDSSDAARYTRCEESAKILAEVKAQCGHKLLLVVCPQCHSPNVLTSAMRFNETFNRERVDARLQFTVHTGATQLLAENFAVDRMCENQRRPFFGAFSANNLLVLDFCGERSTERETGASEVENIATMFERPNSSWVWLEDWSPDLSLNPKGGWRYSKNFLGRWPIDWSSDPTMLMFVRRRRLLRVRVRLNDEVRNALMSYFATATEDEAQ